MKDIAHERTEAAIANLELELKEHYMRASDEMHAKGQAYFEKFKERDREMRDNLKKGKITADQYKNWRLTQIARGKRHDTLADKLAEDAAKADLEAMAMVRGELPDIFALNYNYTAYTIEQTGADVDFSLYDRSTVENLVKNNPDILPDPSPKLTRDMLWNRKHIAAEITTAILQGEDIGKIADRLRNVTDMDERAAIRNARTAMTSAQNSGRQHNYEKAAELGIKVRKKWIATLDGRTRHEHGAMDGQIVDYDKPFKYSLGTMMFPGDMKAPPWMVYNCRCRTVTVEKDGIVAEPVQRRMRNPVTGRNELVTDMTYDEWVAAKEAIEEENKNLPKNVSVIGHTEYGNDNQVKAKLHDYEKDARYKKIESSYTITTSGKIWRVVGGNGSVETDTIPEMLIGSYSYHNHPRNNTKHSFSADDMAFFIANEQRYAEASDYKYRYMLERTEKSLVSSYENVYNEFNSIYTSDIYELSINNDIDIDEDGYDMVVRKICEKYRIKYERVAADD